MNDAKLQFWLLITLFGMVLSGMMIVMTGCTFMEINMVNRATLDEGSGAILQDEIANKIENDSLELIVPIK